MITAFIGVSGSGKTYQRDLLLKKGFVALDFKDALIEMTEDLVGFSIKEDYELFKESLIGLTAPNAKNHSRISCSNMTRDVLSVFPDAMTGRKLLQRLGTEVMRKRDPDYWIKQFADKAHKYIREQKDIVCADCRFENEMEVIKTIAIRHCVDCVFLFCDYHSPRYNPAMTHESEKLAQRFLERGFKDLQRIGIEDLNNVY